MSQFIYDGKFFPIDSTIVGPDNRGLRYGDGLFETMKSKDGKIILLEEHLTRFWKGLDMMQFDLPPLFTQESITAQLATLLQKNQHPDARIRLTAIRGNGGLYDPENLHPHWIIQSWAFEKTAALNINGLEAVIYRDALKPCDQFSNLKHNNYLCYLMGALFAKNNRYNDAIILNQHSRVCDSTIANIFIVKDKNIYTPSLPEGCVAGVMRQYLLKQLPVLGLHIVEQAITEEMLMEADEVFLTNSMFNIKWVSSIQNKKFQRGMIREIYESLSSTNDGVFC